jgi:hypothetical protein
MPTVLTVLIRGGETLSDVVDLTGATAVVGVVMPPEWTAALVTVQGSPDGVFFHDLHDGVTGIELAFNARPGSLVMLNPNRMRSCVAIRLRSGTHDQPVVQELTRQFGIVVEGDVMAQPATGTTAHLIEDATNDFHGISQPFQYAGANVTIETWLKSGNRQAGFEIYNDDGGSRVYFDFSTNTAYSNYAWGIGFVPFDLGIEGPGANGWWKCTASLQIPQVDGLNFWIGLDIAAGQATATAAPRSQGEAYQGDGVSFIQVWQPSLSIDGGANVLVSPEDLTAAAWEPYGAAVQNVPDDLLPASP